MEVSIQCRHVEVPDSLRTVAREKVTRLARHLDGWDHAEIHFFEERNPRIAEKEVCEVTIHGHGHVVRARASATDSFAAVDRVVDKLEHRIEKLKGKLVGRSHPRRHNHDGAGSSGAAELDALDAEIRGQVDALPNKKLVTNHDAFGYYVERYGLDFVGSVIPSFDTQAELSSRELSALVAKIKSEGVRAVFSEGSLPPKTAETVAREAGVRVVAGDDALYGDSLGLPGSGADTYLKMMRHNTRTIVEGLR